ncbi:MAG: hypothetical protein ACPLKP_01160 [Microgenomates group bacterium]
MKLNNFKKFGFKLAILIYFLGLLYLVLPGPVIPELYDSFRSKEPGDTYQFPGIWAFYTDLSRKEVIDFFKKAYGKSWLWGLPLPVIKLNHPPEYCQEKVRDTQRFTYCEELINPLKESLFVAGWTPQEDDYYLKKVPDAAPVLLIEGKIYKTKVILKHIESFVWSRILVWTGIMIGILFLFNTGREIIYSLWKIKK